MNHNQIVKEQLLHLLFGTLIFAAMAAVAVSLDLAAAKVATMGVSAFTHALLEYTAHGMLIVDLVLFCAYLLTSSYRLVVEMLK